MIMNKIVYIYATLPFPGKNPYGGGEVGNLRTVCMLRDDGYKVITIRQRKASAEWGRIKKLFTYPFRMLLGWADVIMKMSFGNRDSIAHLSGFAGKTVFNEYIIMHIMKLLGYRVIYELRGGGAISFWENGSGFYRMMFKYLINKACYVFVQGKENIPLIESICKTPIHYYANCVEDNFAPKELPKKGNNIINLFFYGRCEENKHLDLVVEIAAKVQKEIPNAHLTIIGSGQYSYIEMIKCKMHSLLKPGTYIYKPGCKHEDLPPILGNMHFYIFPSTQPREGQSNSVTECMSYGIIPIASPQGFNRTTIGDDNLIIKELNSDIYSKKIIGIIKENKIDYYSRQVFIHFQNNFTQKVVFEKTLKVYKEIQKL